jgi:hypothetical protein
MVAAGGDVSAIDDPESDGMGGTSYISSKGTSVNYVTGNCVITTIDMDY